jgi:hypothetical protein
MPKCKLKISSDRIGLAQSHVKRDLIGIPLGVVAIGIFFVGISLCYEGTCIADIGGIILGCFISACGIIILVLAITIK